MERRKFMKLAGGVATARPLSDLIAFVARAPISQQSFEPAKPARGGLPPNWGCIHYQWEFRAWVPDAGKYFDMKAYISGLVDAGVEAVHVLTVAERSVFHYATKIGFERDPSSRDWLGEVLEESRRQGVADRLKVIAYYTVTWNNAAARHRPEWQQLDRSGRPVWDKDVFGQNHWAYMCINSPYRDYQYAMLKEIVDNYPGIAAFWFDEPLFPEYSGQDPGCYCKWCEEQFRALNGFPQPRDEKESRARWLAMKRFQVDRIIRYFEDFEKKVLAEHAEISWTWNGQSAPCDWDSRIWKAAPFNSHEVQEGYLMAFMWAKRLASYKRPFELTLGNDYSWVDQRVRPEHELKTFVAISLSHGGGVLVGDYPYADGRFREHKFEWCKGILHWKKAIQEWVEDAENFSEVALFDALDSNWIRYVQTMKPGRGRPTRHAPTGWDLALFGWLKLLGAANIQFDVINENNLMELHKYKLVILPDRLLLGDPALHALESFVAGGGMILATFRTGLYSCDGELSPSPALWRLLGLKFREFSAYRSNYIRLEDRA